MKIPIAIPEPTSDDAAYNQRSLPAYLSALHSAGATPVLVPLHERQDRVAKILGGVQGILLPGSLHDVDPQIYGETAIEACASADPARTAVDELLLQDAFSLHKPIFAICQGVQALNVWRNGTLIQDLQTSVNHRPGREVADAHTIRLVTGSRLASILPSEFAGETKVNSSHHQAIRTCGDQMVATAFSLEDGVTEAIELDSADHFVVGVQWHPERTYIQSSFSRALFAAFIRAASVWQPRRITESVAGL